MRKYIAGNIFEWILCALTAAALSSAMFAGFYISERLAGSLLLPLLLSALFTGLLYLAGYNRKTALICLPVLAGMAVLWLLRLHFAEISIVDGENSPTADYIFYIIVYTVSLAVFCLSRHRFGAFLLLALGSVIIAMLTYLHFAVPAWCVFVFVLAASALIMHRVFRHCRGSGAVVRSSSAGFFLSSLLICVIGVATACGIYYGIVRPLNPPTLDVTLLTKDMTPEILKKLGITDAYHFYDENQRSDRLDEEMNNSETPNEQEEKSTAENDAENDSELISQRDVNATAVNYASVNMLLLKVLAGLVFFIALLWLFLVFDNKRRRGRMLAMPKNEQICRIYRYLVKRYAGLGVPLHAGETPPDYAKRLQAKLPAFMQNGVDFSRLAAIFASVYYGDYPVSDEDHEYYIKAFDSFHVCCRKEVGWLKYLFLFN